jgi:hypothetical protein
MAGRPLRRARLNPEPTRQDWLYLAPLFADMPGHKRIPEDAHDYVRRVEDFVSLLWGHRALEALPLAVAWLRPRELRLVEHLGKGTYGRAFLTNNNTVIKLTMQAAEYEAARALKGRNVPNIAHVFDTAALGSRNGWAYFFLLELEHLRPITQSLTEKLPKHMIDEMVQGCVNYRSITGRDCDMHRENFGLNTQNECALLDLGPRTFP